MPSISIQNAVQGNLKNISLTIPRPSLTVLTGLSGSGKSTLAIDLLYQECQRQYLEAIGYQGIRKPAVDAIHGLSPAIMIAQTDLNKNPRSTVGTLTYIYTDLRMIYEKLSIYPCPHCHTLICAADCQEETEKKDNDFFVYMYCTHCHNRLDKLTRSHFSTNTREGACPHCQGLGKILTLRESSVLNESLSLESGAVTFWEPLYRDYQIASLYAAFAHYNIPFAPNTPVSCFTPLQKALLCHGIDSAEIKKAFPTTPPPKTVNHGKFEGAFTTLWRRLSDKSGDMRRLGEYFDEVPCPDCHGERLNPLSRSATVNGVRLPELSVLSLDQLHTWITDLNLSIDTPRRNFINDYLIDLTTKLRRLINIGLGYLSLDRQTITLSGGELQRVRLAAALDSDITGVIYLLDEPTVGLHPKDTEGMIAVLKKLRDIGNTVIVIEHDPDVMRAADYIIDIGPGAGKHGGELVGTGTLNELMQQESSVTGAYLKRAHMHPIKRRPANTAPIFIKDAHKHNLKHIDVTFPTNCLTAVTGVSGSGKSTLIFDVLAKQKIEGFDQMVTIEQSPITRMKRSNVATYSEVYTEIRKIFGSLQQAKNLGLTAKEFSFNTPGGRCETCEGLGFIDSNLLFFENVEVTCPSCGGRRFSDKVLSVTFEGHCVGDVLAMPVEDARELFRNYPKVERILSLLCDVGLGYLELGQSLKTLSGGEGQRLKLATELLSSGGKKVLYLMDEPTTGLHPVDVENFLILLSRMVDEGNTVIVVEHNQQIIWGADWVVDMGPSGGDQGGRVIFEGTPENLINSNTPTGSALKASSSGQYAEFGD